MSTAPAIGEPRKDLEHPHIPRSGGPTRDQSRAFTGLAAEGLPSERYLRLCRIADTGIAVVVLLGGFLASNIDRMPTGLQEFLQIRLTVTNLLLVMGYTAGWRLICVLFGLYEKRRIRDRRMEALRVLAAVTVASGASLMFPLLSVSHAFGNLAILYFWIGTSAGLLGFRLGLRALMSAQSPKLQDVVIVGSGPRALRLYHDLCGQRTYGYRCLGFIDSADRDLEPEIRGRLLGDLPDLEQILMRQAIDLVLIALPARSRYADIQRMIEICERGGVPARYLTDVFQHRRSGKHQVAAESLTAVPAGVPSDDGRLFAKRCLDVVLGVTLLVAASPVLAVAALAIRLGSTGPVFFAQERYGFNKRRFKMYKLRTMVVDAEKQQVALEVRNEATGPVFKIREDPRVTPVGRLLRRLSIDELPQLVNVIKGDMSLVGPRPLPVRDVGRFAEPWLMRRFSVRPGVTCLWQIGGRSNVGFEQWIALDLEYIDRWSLLLDTTILLRTIPAVLRGNGAV